MNSRVIKSFVWTAILTSGTLFGGALYEQLVIQPMWSSSPPASFDFMTNSRYPVINGLGPFYMLTPLMGLSTIGAAISGWRNPARRWMLSAAIAALIVIGSTFLLFIPQLAIFFGPTGEGYAGGHDPAEVASMARGWVTWNWGRLVAVLVTFVSSVQALKVLSARTP